MYIPRMDLRVVCLPPVRGWRRQVALVLAPAALAMPAGIVEGLVQAQSAVGAPAVWDAGVLATDPVAAAKGRCGAIRVADVQPLLKAPTGAAQVGQGGATCEFVVRGEHPSGGDNLYIVVTVSPNAEIAKELLFGQGVSGFGPLHPLSHLGTKAVWGARSSYSPPHAETSPPEIAAYLGGVSCVVDPPQYPQHTTIPYTTGSDGSPAITPSAAASYAGKEAKVCEDVFSGRMGSLKPSASS
jgi:hypothetical protein